LFDTSNEIFFVRQVVDASLIYKYHEIRERRNLLTHRGTQFDEAYSSALSRKLSKPEAKEFYANNVLKNIQESDGNADVSFSYLLNTFSVLTEYSIALVICGKKFPSKPVYKNRKTFYFDIHDFLRDFILKPIENQSKMNKALLLRNVKMMLKPLNKKQLASFDDVTIVNILIVLSFKNGPKLSYTKFKQDDLNKLLLEILPSNFRDCFSYYYKRNYEKYENIAKNISPEYHSWFMTRDLLNMG